MSKRDFSGFVTEIAEREGLNLYAVTVIDGDGFHGYQSRLANRSNNCYSSTKAFAMTAIGFLVDEGRLSVNDRITDIFRDDINGEYDRLWDAVTVHDTLRHRTGIDEAFLDIDCDNVSAYPSKDYLMMTLNRPIKFAPGEQYCYSDAAFYLISRVVAAASGERIDDFLMKRLFEPLDFVECGWTKCPHGHPTGGSGLYISAHDMAKLGAVYASEGEYFGKKILSPEWCRTSMEQSYAWWSGYNGEIYGKGGMLGQTLMFAPKYHRALAVLACERRRDMSVLTNELVCEYLLEF